MGRYTFEIHATEDDLVSETSVTVALNVGLPYRQIGLVSILCLILAGIWLIARASHRDRSSQGSPAEPEKNDNDRIREWVMEHIQAELRGRISLMKKEEDLVGIAEEMIGELSSAGMDIDLCVISIIDEASNVCRQYGAAREGGSGLAKVPLSQMSDEFLTIYMEEEPRLRQVDDDLAEVCFQTRKRLGITGEAIRPTAVVGAPFSYGTLSFQTQNPDGFPGDDIALVREFAGVMSLGYARFLGFRTVERTQRQLIRTQQQLIREMEEELQTAHNMQMRLMPLSPPEVEGFDIAGRCIPANHVGGDYFQYFHQDGRLCVALADVTGHAMEAAIPVVMFSGILKIHMELHGTLQECFEALNRSMYGALTKRTAICFVMAEICLPTCSFRLSDGGIPYPYHFRADDGTVAELQADAYPLGVRPNTEYELVETQLQPGDRVVFCSDGIIEADNTDGEQFGFEQTAETIRKACEEGLSAEATIDRILERVAAFKGNAAQSDDMTCVVVRVEDG